MSKSYAETNAFMEFNSKLLVNIAPTTKFDATFSGQKGGVFFFGIQSVWSFADPKYIWEICKVHILHLSY